MPTALRRLQVTETAEVAHALEVAARRWPEITSRSALLAEIAKEGARTVEAAEASRRDERRRLIDSLAGGFDDAFPPGYLAELRQDWPD